MSDMKHTAVEWLTIQVHKRIPTVHNDALIEDFNQALEMEQAQLSELRAQRDEAVKALVDIINTTNNGRNCYQQRFECGRIAVDTLTKIKGGQDGEG